VKLLDKFIVTPSPCSNVLADFECMVTGNNFAMLSGFLRIRLIVRLFSLEVCKKYEYQAIITGK